MFNFMEAAGKLGVEVIPFSIQNPQNCPTEYAPYFARPRADALMYADTKRSLRNLYGMLRATLWNVDAARRLRRLIRDTRPDAVYILHQVNHLSPSIIHAAKREGVRVVHRMSDFFMFCGKYDFLCGEELCEACLHRQYGKALRERCIKGSLAATLLRVSAMKLHWLSGVFQEVDQYIAPSAFTVGKMVEGGVPEGKILHIPTFIDSRLVVPCYTCKNYFLFLGRMTRQKGTIYAIRAMTLLRDSGYVLKITGTLSDSEEDRELKACIAENHLEDQVVFTGFLHGDALSDLIDGAACVVCPAIWYENMPNTVLEAYAHGKPVVATRLGSLTELVEDGKTGFLFARKDWKELAEKLWEFVRDDGLSRRMGRNGRRKCELEYGMDLHMERVLSCLAGSGGKRLKEEVTV